MIKSRIYFGFFLIILFLYNSNFVLSQIKQNSLVDNDSIELTKQSLVNDLLYGTLIDREYREPIPFANIVIEADGKPITGTTSDFNGFYKLRIPDTLNQFKVRITYVGYATQEVLVDRETALQNENNSKDNSEAEDN